MTRNERIANIVVISLLLIGGAIGGTRLVLKKLHKPAEYTFPPAVVREWAYMDPNPGPVAGLPRFTPPRLGGWLVSEVRRLILTPGVKSLLADGAFRPIVSRDLSFQLVAQGTSDDAQRVGLITWHRKFKDLKPNFTARAIDVTGKQLDGTIEGLVGVPIPLDIRSELNDSRYVNPPDLCVWLQVRFDTAQPVREIELDYSGSDVRTRDILTLPGDSAQVSATSHP